MFINPSQKLYRHFAHLAQWMKGELFPPIGMEIDLSNRCNLGCADCDFRFTHSRGPHASKTPTGDLMDFDLLKRILQEMKDCGVESVTFSGGGEPTLHPRFGEALHAASELFPLGLYTNGTQLETSLARQVRQEATWVVVSLDAVDASDYLAYKGVDKFEDVLGGVSTLIGGKATIGLSFLLSERNFFHAPSMVNLHKELGTDYVEFRPLIQFNPTNPAEPTANLGWISDCLKILAEFDGQPGVETRLESFRAYQAFGREYKVCEAILFTGIVSADGRMWRCVNSRGYDCACLGDLNEEHFATVWLRQKPWADFARCRVLCRGDAINRALAQLKTPLPHQEFI
jgi:MoaA/NifB/PqqE/SkfB family radical SAM enzyme